jgi:hypothetical protein
MQSYGLSLTGLTMLKVKKNWLGLAIKGGGPPVLHGRPVTDRSSTFVGVKTSPQILK